MKQRERGEGKEGEGWVTKKTGLKIHPYFSASKIKWLVENVEEVREALKGGRCLFGTVDSFLVWKLTGNHFTDVTNASRTMLMNLETLKWDEEILGLLEIPVQSLPEIKSSAENFGKIRGAGRLDGVEISGCLGDQQAALVGQNCLKRGECKNTYGTGLFLLVNTGEQIVYSNHQMLTTVAFQMEGKTFYALEGSVATAGAGISWLKDNLKFLESTNQISQIPAENGGVYFVPAFSGLLAPHWEPNAHGVIVGLSNYSSREHICRAMLESLAFSTLDVIDAMNEDCKFRIDRLLVDGGVTKSDALLQFQSDVLGIPVVRPAESVEATALGAAFAAGVAKRIFSLDQNFFRPTNTFHSSMEDSVRQLHVHNWKVAVETALISKKLKKIESK